MKTRVSNENGGSKSTLKSLGALKKEENDTISILNFTIILATNRYGKYTIT